MNKLALINKEKELDIYLKRNKSHIAQNNGESNR